MTAHTDEFGQPIDPGLPNWTYLACGPFATIGAYHTWMETICLGTESIFFAIAAAAQRRFGGVAGDLNGRNCDTAWFATIDTAWPALRTAFAPWLAPDNFDNQGRQRTRLTDLTRPIREKNAAQM